MSERKEEEELVEHEHEHEHGSSSESSESEQMVDAEVELEESPQQEEDHDNPSGNSDSQPSDEGDKNVESAEDVQMNGDISSPHKSTTVDGTSSADDLRGEDDHVCSVDGTKRESESELVVKEGNASFVQPDVVLKGGLETKGGENAKELNDFVESKCMEELRNVKESNGMEESKNVEESKSSVESKDVGKMMDVEDLKDVKELRDTEEVKKEINAMAGNPVPELNGVREENMVKRESSMVLHLNTEMSNQSFPSQLHMADGDDGTDEEQAAFVKELESFFRERGMEFKHPKFYGEGLNCLKLWRAVTKLGGYDRVTACKLWRQVGESFKPPKTCTTVSWSFRIFYEKALLDYERHKMRGGELMIPASPLPEPMNIENHMGGHQGSGRARRDAAARAMQGWHSQRLLGNGEVGDPIIKDKNPLSTPKREKHLKSVGLLKRKKPSILDRSVKAARTITKVTKPQIDTDVADIGTPAADWVKINVLRTKDCFEVYALVPGLLREEVRVQSDPAGRLVISGDPEQPDNPWGVTPFKKVITLPSRIDPHQTSAVVTLHGQLFVRVPFEQSDL